MADYAHPQSLVSTDSVAERLNDPAVRIVEVDVDTAAYDENHIPGAVAWNWTTQLCDTVRRDVVAKGELERLLSASGVSRETTVVLYGDNHNWFAAWALWQLEMYRHPDVRLMDGGRKKWLSEGRETATDKPSAPPADYRAAEPDLSLRAFLPQVRDAVASGSAALVDVRSPLEFSGEVLAPPDSPEACQRGGHIPGAVNVPWNQTCREDGAFKSRDELAELYTRAGVAGDKPIIAYCRIGERSSHSWFVLKRLLGFPDVANYDGSWTEWGNLVGAPIERGAAAGAPLLR